MINRRSIIVPEGLPFIAASSVMALLMIALSYRAAAAGFLAVTLFIACFFRNPERMPPDQPGAVISPADGKVIRIDSVQCEDLVKGSYVKISIFMNVFNVHVNRIPYSGKVKRIRYREGKFISAHLDKASVFNECNAVVIATDKEQEILVVQIAGLIARRIVCWIKEGMTVERGERFGLIRFGSRLDVYLPFGAKIAVTVGAKVKAGETVLGELL